MNKLVYGSKKEQIVLSTSGEYEIVLNAVEEAVIEIKEHVKAVVLLKLQNIETISVSLMVEKNAQANILHQCEESISINERGYIYKDALLKSGFYVLDEMNSTMDVKYFLKESGADAFVMTSTLSSAKNTFDVECVHEVCMTSSMMENYAISKESGNYTITASGRISKGAYGSKSHQSTRVLTMGNKQNASVTPLLLIDENDVEASHACAVGAMNEDHLYYLKTRGLNDTQALGLLTLSYVLPLLRIVEGTCFEEIVEKEIESKVGLSC